MNVVVLLAEFSQRREGVLEGELSLLDISPRRSNGSGYRRYGGFRIV